MKVQELFEAKQGIDVLNAKRLQKQIKEKGFPFDTELKTEKFFDDVIEKESSFSVITLTPKEGSDKKEQIKARAAIRKLAAALDEKYHVGASTKKFTITMYR